LAQVCLKVMKRIDGSV